MRRLTRIIGTLMIIAGAGALAWALTVWQWQDPFTFALQKLEQRELADAFDQRLAQTAPAGASAATLAQIRRSLPVAAAKWRKGSKRGDAVARIRVPRLGLNEIVVNGTDHDSLKRGHRTTYGAPFSRIDRLRKGDRVFVELPYGTLEYSVTGQRIVRATETKVLESKGFEQLALQACHPRFFATHRLIAYAKVVGFAPPGGGKPTPFEALG